MMKDYHDLGTRHVVSAAYPYANHQLVGIVAPDDDTVVRFIAIITLRH